MHCPPVSLRHRLTSKVILFQVLTLMAFGLCIPLIEFSMGYSSFFQPDPTISEDIAASMVDEAGELSLRPTAELIELMREAPDFWFVVADETGQRMSHGNVPEEMAAVSGAMNMLSAVEFTQDGAGHADAFLKIANSPVGEVRILFGEGPMMKPAHAVLHFAKHNVWPALMLLLVVLAGLTALAVPRIINQSLSGLRQTVRQAEQLDVDKRGGRLSAEDVPEEIASLVVAMNEALERIDEGYERHQRFLANAAHELRTPIAILQNRIELNMRDATDVQLLLDAKRISNLAEQLLDFQRLGHQETAMERVDLVAIARRVMSDLAPLAVDAGYEPQFETEVGAFELLGDGSAIERSIINIVQNAIAYGGNTGRITVYVRRNGSVEINDDGKGVPDEQRHRIFEPFYRVKPRDRGAGLGLSLVREIMSRHNGHVFVGDSESGGARFALNFTAAALH